MSIAALRKEYMLASLNEADTAEDPGTQFGKWFNEAIEAQLPEPNAMSVATVNSHGRPSSRIVLIKGFGPEGFAWFTNYESRKGQELQSNPYAALLFHWIELERQVRIEGKVQPVIAAESDAYFHSRPLGSRISAIASAQSRNIENREQLERQYLQAQQAYGDNPPRPANWGGYRLTPDYMEFWQGRSSRLHDRIAYRIVDGLWYKERLQP